MCTVGGVLHDTDGSSDGLDVHGGGEAAPNNPLCSLPYPVESLPLYSRAAVMPHSDTEAEDTLHHASVEGGQDRAPEFKQHQSPEEIQLLMSLPNQTGSVVVLDEVLAEVG